MMIDGWTSEPSMPDRWTSNPQQEMSEHDITKARINDNYKQTIMKSDTITYELVLKPNYRIFEWDDEASRDAYVIYEVRKKLSLFARIFRIGEAKLVKKDVKSFRPSQRYKAIQFINELRKYPDIR